MAVSLHLDKQVNPKQEDLMTWGTVRFFVLNATVVGLVLLNVGLANADSRAKDEERLQNSGQVTQELMNIPDGIPRKLLNRADCVIGIPSVL